MTSQKPVKKLIWAIDVFSEDKELRRKTLQILNSWVKGTQISIQPVTVLTPEQLNIPTGLFAVQSQDAEAIAEERMSKIVKGLKTTRVLPPKVLFSANVSVKFAIAALVAYAKRQKADLIAVSAHSKKAVTRFLFGSFSESLILQSDVPTFLISPTMHEQKKLTHILFPTDLSEASRETLETVAGFAKERGASLMLFHKLEYVNVYGVPGLQSPEIYMEFLREDIDDRKKRLQEWADSIRERGIDVETHLNEKSGPGVGGTVWESIVAAARKTDAGIIAMASHTERIAAVLLGSTTRQVVRHAPCPIWVLHPSPAKPVLIGLTDKPSSTDELVGKGEAFLAKPIVQKLLKALGDAGV